MKTHVEFGVLLFGFTSLVFAELQSPKNVTLRTLNTKYVMKWDWDQRVSSYTDVTFTAQYLAKFKSKSTRVRSYWTTVCNATSKQHCDFTPARLYYQGIWLLRVRAQNDTHASTWVQIEFCPDRDAVIGPPSAVNVRPVKGLLEVSISDPLTIDNTSMKEQVDDFYYIIQYWKKPLQMQKPDLLVSTNNLVILPNLERWTLYCVRVQSRYDFYNKSSAFSPTYCVETDGQMPYWQIFLYFLLSLALSFLFVLGLSFCFIKAVKVIKSTFYPSIQLPVHIQEYLIDSPGSDVPRLLTTELEADVVCDRLDIVFPDHMFVTSILEIHAPPQDSEQDGSNHSRHSSGDSGVYSAEEGSGQSLRREEDVKLEKMGQINFHREQESEVHERIEEVPV